MSANLYALLAMAEVNCCKIVHVFVSLTINRKVVTSEACLRTFIARRGKRSLIWSDNGTNFVGAASKIKQQQESLSKFLSSQMIEWKSIPQHASHFGRL